MSQVQESNSESLFNRKDFKQEVTEKKFPLCAESFRHREEISSSLPPLPPVQNLCVVLGGKTPTADFSIILLDTSGLGLLPPPVAVRVLGNPGIS
ncbi:hypothetical protein SBV1_1110008 [Verrucomicrobia bacterium]|nr:hypothetical protein SBV1_1110008 [Verrucomicrobiota bacterium]